MMDELPDIVNDTWCLEMNFSELVERNLTYACKNVFGGPSLPSTFMAIIQIFYALVSKIS